MNSFTLTPSDLQTEIYNLIVSLYSNKIKRLSDSSNTQIIVTYSENDLVDFSIKIEEITDNVFTSDEYLSLKFRTKTYIHDYFYGLIYLHKKQNEKVDVKVKKYFSLDIGNLDDDIINTVFTYLSANTYDILKNYNDILIYEFIDSDDYHLVFINSKYETRYARVEEEDLPTFHRYLSLCLERKDTISLDTWIEEEYSHDIERFKKFLERYTDENIFDRDYARDRLIEDEYFFSDYEEADIGEDSYDYYSSLIQNLYDKGKIPLSAKESLLNIDEETYNEIILNLRESLEISIESNSPDDDIYYIFSDSYRHTEFITIYESDIEDWDDNYQLCDWLTYSKLYDLIRETDSVLEADSLWNIYKQKSKYTYEQDYDIRCNVYISYDKALDSLSDVFILKKGKLGQITTLISSESNPNKDKSFTTFEKKIQKIEDPIYYRIASLLGKHLNYDLNSKITLKDFKKIANSDEYLKRLLPTKNVNYILNKFTKGFSINDLKSIDTPVYTKGSLFEYLTEQEKISLDDVIDIDITSAKWKSNLQTITNKYNYVFQFNLKKAYLDKILDHFGVSDENRVNLKNYHRTKHSVHPVQNNERYISLGWIRYTVNPTITYNDVTIEGILLDEVQSDLDNKEYLGKDIMKGWQNIILKEFVQYVRKNLGYNKIYMPTPDIKADKYRAFRRDADGEIIQNYTANLLYKQLPSSFGFLPSEIKGFNLLEKRVTN